MWKTKIRSEKGFGWKYVVLLVIVFAVGVAVPKIVDKLRPEEPHSASDVAEGSTPSEEIVLVQEKVPYTVTVSFDEIILGETVRTKKLEVMTQNISASHTETKNGPFNWDIFAQTKAMVFHGKGIYTVDLEDIKPENFVVDHEKRKISIHIPEPKLSVELLPEKTEFFDTANGFLRFGEMDLTPEMMTKIEVAGKEKLIDTLKGDREVADMAKHFAKLSVKEIFQPLVTAQVNAAVKAENDEYAMPVYYTVEVVIDD